MDADIGAVELMYHLFAGDVHEGRGMRDYRGAFEDIGSAQAEGETLGQAVNYVHIAKQGNDGLLLVCEREEVWGEKHIPIPDPLPDYIVIDESSIRNGKLVMKNAVIGYTWSKPDDR